MLYFLSYCVASDLTVIQRPLKASIKFLVQLRLLYYFYYGFPNFTFFTTASSCVVHILVKASIIFLLQLLPALPF
jgi:hypothetical protein